MRKRGRKRSEHPRILDCKISPPKKKGANLKRRAKGEGRRENLAEEILTPPSRYPSRYPQIYQVEGIDIPKQEVAKSPESRFFNKIN